MTYFRLGTYLTATLSLCILLTGTIRAQDEFCNKPKKKALKYWKEANKNRHSSKENFYLVKAVQEDEDFAEAYLRLGDLKMKELKNDPPIQPKAYENLENRMIEYYTKAVEACPEIQNGDVLYEIGKIYYFKKDFGTAKAYLADYVKIHEADKTNKERDEAAYLVHRIETYQEIMANPVEFNPVKVRGVSTKDEEYLPMLSPDNKYLFFTRKQMVDTKGAFGSVEREVFTRSKNNYDGSFELGEAMLDPFNLGLHQGGSSISVDNKLIFVTVIKMEPFRRPNMGMTLEPMGDIYYTEFHEGAWSDLKSVGENINKYKRWEGQPSISADNKTLYFTRADAEKPGQHYGGMDIYKSERQEDGSWGPAINLGPEINTKGNEKTPFMHSDSYTLYFASDGHAGVGNFDIFYSKMNEEGEFSRPKNLGYPINTEEDEHGFVVSTDGLHGYFSSLMDEESLDIYSFELYKEARPEKVVFVKGETISGKEALEGLEIKLKNVVTNKEVEAVLDEESGEYVGVIAVKENEDVLMTAKKDGYAFTSQYISSNEAVVGKPVQENVEVKKIEKGETYRINDINFATNSYDLNKTIEAILDEFGEFLMRNENMAVELHGHTDNVGNKDENQVLSENRAKAVYNYLIEVGVPADRLAYKGFGPSKPVSSNDTNEGRAMNRRTEFLVISD